MGDVRFVIYANDPFGLNYYSPQHNLANTADNTWEGTKLLTADAVVEAIKTTTTMLVDAPFTHIIMGFFGLANTDANSPWYQHDTPIITWNGVPITPTTTPPGGEYPNEKWGLAPNVAENLLQIVDSGKTLIASMQHDADLAYIQEHWSADDFYEALNEQVLNPLHFNGLDLDMESGWDMYPNVLIDLSNTFGKNDRLVSHAPYGQLDCTAPFGMLAYYLCVEQGQPLTPIAGHTVIEGEQGRKTNSISWLNNQYYSGGDQGSASNVVQQYVAAIDAAAAIPEAGISEPAYFCVAGFAPCICDPDFQLWNQPRDQTQVGCKAGKIQTDGCTSATVVMDAVNGLVQHYGMDPSGRARFGGVFIYSYRYYDTTQPGYAYQVDTWNMIASALGLA